MGQPSPDILDDTHKKESIAKASMDLSGENMARVFLKYRPMVEDGFYSMHIDPDTGEMVIRDENDKIIFMHENGIQFEATFQEWLEKQRRKKQDRKSGQ